MVGLLSCEEFGSELAPWRSCDLETIVVDHSARLDALEADDQLEADVKQLEEYRR